MLNPVYDLEEIGLEGKSLVSIGDLEKDQIQYLMGLTRSIKHTWEKGNAKPQHTRTLEGYNIACLFYEPSTRTSSSFIAAVNRLGGTAIPITQGVDFSSVSKGETLEDTARTLAQYSDVVVLRHPERGSAQRAAHALSLDGVPLINAGDGHGEHPTQALLDLFTILEAQGDPSGKHLVFVGDLAYGRTVHSLLKLLAPYKGIRYSFVAPGHLKLPRGLVKLISENAESVKFAERLQDVVRTADVIYMTRAQVERQSKVGQLATKFTQSRYRLTKSMMTSAKQNLIVLHPFPRLEELDRELDGDIRVIPFRQIKNGMYLRMALLLAVLGEDYYLQPKKSIFDAEYFTPGKSAGIVQEEEDGQDEVDYGHRGRDLNEDDDQQVERVEAERESKEFLEGPKGIKGSGEVAIASLEAALENTRGPGDLANGNG